MKNTLPLLFAILPVVLFAQSWTIGSSWLYEQQDYYPSPIPEYYAYFEIESDTVIGNDTLLVLQQYYVTKFGSTIKFEHQGAELIKKLDNKVYLRSKENGGLHLVYDFDAQVGDTLTLIGAPQGVFSYELLRVVIDSNGIDAYNGVNWDVQYVSTVYEEGNVLQFDGRIVKGVGHTSYLLPWWGVVDPPPGGSLLCAFVDTLEYPYPGNVFCNTVLSASTIPDALVSVSPNPTTGVVSISTHQVRITTWEVYDRSGRKVLCGEAAGTVDLSGLPDGVYFLYLTDEADRIKLVHVVKNRG